MPNSSGEGCSRIDGTALSPRPVRSPNLGSLFQLRLLARVFLLFVRVFLNAFEYDARAAAAPGGASARDFGRGGGPERRAGLQERAGSANPPCF